MVQHTPGPWHALINSRPSIVVEHPLREVARINHKLGDASEQAADARLIAAAPDLLAACQDALTWVLAVCGTDAGPLVQELEAAIWAATREEG